MREFHRRIGRPFGAVKRRSQGDFATRSGLTILGWHRIGDAMDGLTTTSVDFEAQLRCLEALNANVIPLAEGVQGLKDASLPPRAVALTFDDGYASVAELAWPLLNRRGLPATLFVVPGYMEPGQFFPWDRPSDETRLLTAEEIRGACFAGLDIQSHSLRHRWLPGGSSRDVLQDLAQSRILLGELLDTPVTGLAYPTGGWNKRVREIAQAAGYSYAVTVDRGVNPLLWKHPHSLRRAFVPDSVEDLELLLAGGFDYLRPIDRARRRLRNRRSRRADW